MSPGRVSKPGTSGDGPSVCVIGAGAIGLCAALQLARRGASHVTVVEATHPAAGSSGLSVGIVETQYLDPLDIELRVRSMRFFEHLERDHGLGIVRNGYLRLGHTPEAREAFQRSMEHQHTLGVRDARVLDREQVARLVPHMRSDDVTAGLYGSNDGYLDGHLYCALLTQLAEEAGVELLVGRQMVGAERRSGGGLRVQTAPPEWRGRGGLGVHSSRPGEGVECDPVECEAVECDVVVNAAGAWAGRVAALLGHRLELLPQRHQAAVVHLSSPLGYTMPSVMDYTPGSGRNGLYFRHEGPGRLIAGLHREEPSDDAADPDMYARNADEPFLEEVAALLCARLPSLSASRLAGGWAGLYPVSPTGRPLVGPLGEGPEEIVVGGAGGSGIQLSPVLGELAADWVLEGRPSCLPAAHVLRPTLGFAAGGLGPGPV